MNHICTILEEHDNQQVHKGTQHEYEEHNSEMLCCFILIKYMGICLKYQYSQYIEN